MAMAERQGGSRNETRGSSGTLRRGEWDSVTKVKGNYRINTLRQGSQRSFPAVGTGSDLPTPNTQILKLTQSGSVQSAGQAAMISIANATNESWT